ncbi:hypothetical protein E5554_12450 [Sphingobium sp. PAMC28499]|nr:hypothetical protein E5554_12450 [Sphingobium sp. PAMC28499]
MPDKKRATLGKHEIMLFLWAKDKEEAKRLISKKSLNPTRCLPVKVEHERGALQATQPHRAHARPPQDQLRHRQILAQICPGRRAS